MICSVSFITNKTSPGCMVLVRKRRDYDNNYDYDYDYNYNLIVILVAGEEDDA